MFLVGEVTIDLVPGLGGLPGAWDGEIDFAGSEAFSGHGTSRGVVGKSTAGIIFFYLPR